MLYRLVSWNSLLSHGRGKIYSGLSCIPFPLDISPLLFLAVPPPFGLVATFRTISSFPTSFPTRFATLLFASISRESYTPNESSRGDLRRYYT